jgi:hypothetical protein
VRAVAAPPSGTASASGMGLSSSAGRR